ncbi:MAG TPA: hypothetical protein VIO14_02835 [Dehalococcoidia bacterium]
MPGRRRLGPAAALALAVAALAAGPACRSNGSRPAEPAPTPVVRATPAPSDEEMAARIYDTALSLRAAVVALINDVQAGVDPEPARERVGEACREAATLFRDANVEGVVEIRDLCREINTRGQPEDVQFWRDIRTRLDALVEQYREDARQPEGGANGTGGEEH